jgi:endoglucanase
LEDWASASPRVTPIGNVLANIPGDGPRLLIETHSDEIGLLVKSITAGGFLKVTLATNGSELLNRPSEWLRMQPVKVKARDGWIDGVIGIATAHVLTAEQAGKTQLDWSDLFVDIGARGRDGVEAQGIEIGSPIVFASQARRMGDTVSGKALDARASLAIMTAFLQRLDRAKLKYDVTFAAAVMEEMGWVGAGSLGKDPYDLAIGIEVGLAGDIPAVDPEQMPTRLGAGPVLVIKDRVLAYDVGITTRLKETARRNGIPYQPAVFQTFSSDLRQLAEWGVPSALITYATRYTHTPWETASLLDMEQIVQLLLAFVTE